MRRLYIPLDDRTFDRLLRLAEQERRHPRQQAAWLLEMALLALAGDQQTEQPGEPKPGREVQPCGQ